MSFDSLIFILLFSSVTMIYYVIPIKYRSICLVIASYYFYVFWNVKYAFVLFGVTGITYISALMMSRFRKKMVLFICVISNLLLLGSFKYLGFIINSINSVFKLIGLQILEPGFSFIVPLGISFYMLQALGYVIDVYRGKIQAETNFVNYALYVSFFPTLVSGPIERSRNLLKQIQAGTNFSYERVKKGLLRMSYGYFEKILIANNISRMTNNAYEHYSSQPGGALLLAIVLYGIQIYTDFAGYSNIAIGAAEVLGFELKQNFRQPYFASSIKEFWKRWHISLSSWLQDYVYIPLGGSKKGVVRTYCNLMITFIVSAIWHGAGWKYIIWGGLHGMYQISGRITSRGRHNLYQRMGLKEKNYLLHIFRIGITFALVDFAWLFFSAPSMRSAIVILYRVIVEFQLVKTIKDGYYLFGIGENQFVILFIGIILIFIVDLIHETNISITEWLNGKNIAFRWSVYVVIASVLLLGIISNYGIEASSFLYAQF